MNLFLKRCTFSSLVIVGMLAGCGSVPVSIPYPPPQTAPPATSAPASSESRAAPLSLPPTTASAPLQQTRSRWIPVAWEELPGLGADPLNEAWQAWLRSCERPGSTFAPMCADVHRLSLGSDDERRNWLVSRLQPYRVESHQGDTGGLLTGYYEPVIEASRVRNERFNVPLYKIPTNFYRRKPWYSRQEIDTLPEAQAALKGREIAWLADPVAALNIQIQGSGQLQITEPDGRQRLVRLGYAGTNDQPYRSVGRWLMDKGFARDGSWPTIRNWVTQNPGKVQEMLWSNPRVTFFSEHQSESAGPRGAQGVALTAGRSIAVDPLSIPYGTPVWLVSSGAQVQLNRLVLAQDTGSAIVGAVRADYFVGTGPEASALAGRLKQPLRLWVLWPR